MKRAPPIVLAVVWVAIAGCGDGGRSEPGLTSDQTDQFLSVQQSLTNEQATLSRGRYELEQDRRTWDARERRDPIVANSIYATGMLIACVLPLAIVMLLLWNNRNVEHRLELSDAVLTEYLFVNDAPRRMEEKNCDAPKLPAPK
ncbi:hypothetical protein [Allorhodopirellula heiligendammensis]|uniref:Lipoprotein n=1 Tax=Allorhodopirellula heiligendammensis TaxID=2714739 RepID=A0A5C6BCF2_9BACT|nr:hypothetical protein [Allorhodopirellula heiligendammensis]TWU09895.1 hypothetical protein Poly21_54440 [Allorhodopirellula heiligendammensis]